jgi:hypothetical protein
LNSGVQSFQPIERIEDIRRRRAAMALRCNGAPAGLANELWADAGYLLNALEQAERIVDELVACPPDRGGAGAGPG